MENSEFPTLENCSTVTVIGWTPHPRAPKHEHGPLTRTWSAHLWKENRGRAGVCLVLVLVSDSYLSLPQEKDILTGNPFLELISTQRCKFLSQEVR